MLVRADCSGFWGSSRGATFNSSMGRAFWGPASRQLKAQEIFRICSKDSSRSASVSQLFASQRGQRRRAAKVLDMRGLLQVHLSVLLEARDRAEGNGVLKSTVPKDRVGLLTNRKQTKKARREDV